MKPDSERVKRICPDGVPEPPEDIVAFFAEAGVDIGGKTDYAVASTGPYRNLRERVAKARELGAFASPVRMTALFPRCGLSIEVWLRSMIARASVSGRALFVCKRLAPRSSKDQCEAWQDLREPASR